MSFSEILLEDKGGKNLHLEHIEDEILNYGVDGGRAALPTFSTRYAFWFYTF
jgi:hypothetical protein